MRHEAYLALEVIIDFQRCVRRSPEVGAGERSERFFEVLESYAPLESLKTPPKSISSRFLEALLLDNSGDR